VAWPESLPPLERDGESALELDELDESEELEDEELEEDEVSAEVLEVDAAWAATPTASVPARLAAISAPVIVVVRRSPVSRSMARPPHLLTTQRTVPDPLLEGLCCC
jgi:hypothetical protein